MKPVTAFHRIKVHARKREGPRVDPPLREVPREGSGILTIRLVLLYPISGFAASLPPP